MEGGTRGPDRETTFWAMLRRLSQEKQTTEANSQTQDATANNESSFIGKHRNCSENVSIELHAKFSLHVTTPDSRMHSPLEAPLEERKVPSFPGMPGSHLMREGIPATMLKDTGKFDMAQLATRNWVSVPAMGKFPSGIEKFSSLCTP